MKNEIEIKSEKEVIPVIKKKEERREYTTEEKKQYVLAKKKKVYDKIFNNSYNAGEIEYEVYDKVQIDHEFLTSLKSVQNSYDYYENATLMEYIHDFFNNKGCNVKSKEFLKKHKKNIQELYLELYESLIIDKISFTHSLLLVFFSDYLCVSLEFLYKEIPYRFREKILKELDDSIDIVKRKKIRRLY